MHGLPRRTINSTCVPIYACTAQQTCARSVLWQLGSGIRRYHLLERTNGCAIDQIRKAEHARSIWVREVGGRAGHHRHRLWGLTAAVLLYTRAGNISRSTTQTKTTLIIPCLVPLRALLYNNWCEQRLRLFVYPHRPFSATMLAVACVGPPVVAAVAEAGRGRMLRGRSLMMKVGLLAASTTYTNNFYSLNKARPYVV